MLYIIILTASGRAPLFFCFCLSCILIIKYINLVVFNPQNIDILKCITLYFYVTMLLITYTILIWLRKKLGTKIINLLHCFCSQPYCQLSKNNFYCWMTFNLRTSTRMSKFLYMKMLLVYIYQVVGECSTIRVKYKPAKLPAFYQIGKFTKLTFHSLKTTKIKVEHNFFVILCNSK